MKINEGSSTRRNQVNRDTGSTAPAREADRARNETPAEPPRDVAAERARALRDQDVFEVRPAVRAGPDLTGGISPAARTPAVLTPATETPATPAAPTQTEAATFDKGRTSATITTTDAGGNKTIDSFSTGAGNVVIGSKTENADESGHANSVKFTQDSATFSHSTTGTNGVTNNTSVGVTTTGGNFSRGVEVQGPRGLSVKFDTSASFSRDAKSENGFTTATAQGTMNVTLGGGVDAGVGGFSAELTHGVRSQYQVRMSDADYARVQSGELPHPDPFNPETMPTGSSVLQNSTDYTGGGFEAAYRNLKLQGNITQEDGVSTLTEKTGPNTVRVTAGPTEALESSFQLGLTLGPASAHIGSTTRVDSRNLQTAEFDISTDEGRAAYNEFLVSGQFPEQNGPGISNVATVDRLHAESTARAGASLGPWAGEVVLGSNKMDQTRTTYPDGSRNQVSTLDYSSTVPVTFNQTLRPDGTEDLSQQRITLDIQGTDAYSASYLYEAFTGDSEGAAALQDGGPQDVQISFTHEQAQQLQERVREQVASFDPNLSPSTPSEDVLRDIANASSPEAVAAAIGRGWSGDGVLAERFLNMVSDSMVGDTMRPLPGTVTVTPRPE